jgi:hypothetical protein
VTVLPAYSRASSQKGIRSLHQQPIIAAGLPVREAATRLKVGKTALYKALEGVAAKAKA